MAFSTLFFVALLAGLSAAVPLGSSSSRAGNLPTECAYSLCPASTAEKLAFEQGKSYIYSYRSQSDVILHGVRPEAESSMVLESQVVLSWQSPCQVAVAIKNPTINGKSDPIMSEQLTHKPLIATIIDGVVTEVCADHDDHPSSLNMKKGIVSSIQNVLPKLSPSFSDQTYDESDILGQCPTKYSIQDNGSSYIIKKTKNHKQCSRKHTIGAESPAMSWWQKAPAPLRESHSECSQEVRKSDKVITSVSCRDVNDVSVLPQKHMKAVHDSKMSLSNIVQGSISPTVSRPRITDLSFEAARQPKTQQVVPAVKELLKKICASTAKSAQKESASQVAKLIGHLNRVPEQTVKQLHEEIRQGSFCQSSQSAQRLEGIFLDAIAFAENGGAIEVMTEQITSGRATGGRTALYTMALHLAKKPCIHSVRAVSPLFDSEKAPSAIVLAASSLVRKYCQANPTCRQQPAVQEIQQKLANQIENSQCAATASNQQQKSKVLTALKAAGNVESIISRSLERSILKCLETKEADAHVRSAAAEAFRHASCQHQPTSELLQTALDRSENTEVRISTYLAAVKCASKQQLQQVVSKMSQEANNQVRSYVLSHLRNVQQSDAPHLHGRRYDLASIIIPTDYEQDLRKDSRNIDLSYYSPTFGVGAGIDASSVFAQGSYLPRQMRANITAKIFENLVNVGEVSVRADDLEDLMDAAFGPEGYFQGKERSQIFTEMFGHLQSKGSKIMEDAVRRFSSQGRKVNWNSPIEIYKSFQSREGERSQTPKLDAFARVLGQEVLFASFSPNLRNINFDALAEKALEAAERFLMDASDVNSNPARAMQVNIESFVPTAQGVPLQVKIVATSVASMEVQSQLSTRNSKVKLAPSVSFDLNTFIGFSVGAKAGIRARAQAALQPQSTFQLSIENQQFEAVIDMPSKAKLVDSDFQTYMMFKLPAQQDQRTSPRSEYPKMTTQGCSQAAAQAAGIEFCYEISVPNYRQSNLFPLGDAKVELELKKQKPEQPAVKVSGRAKSEQGEKSLELQLQAPGSPNPRKGEAEVEYKSSPQHQSVKVFARGSGESQGRAAKLELQTQSTQHGGRAQLSAYYAKQKQISTSDEVLSAQFQGGQENEELQAKVDIKTKSELAQYVDANVEVDVSTKLSESNVPKSIDIRKFEANVRVRNSFSTKNYIRKRTSSMNKSWESAPSTQYQFQSLTRTPSREVLRVSGAAKSKGEAAAETLETSVEMSVQTPNSGAEAEAKLSWNRQQKQALLRYQQKNSQQPSFFANVSATRQSQSSSSIQALAQLEIPSLIPSYKIEGSAEQRQQQRGYDVKLVAKKNDEPIYEAKGPLTASSDEESCRAKTELQIKSLSDSKEHKVKGRFLWSPQSKDAMVDWQTNGEPAFSAEAEHKQQGESSCQTTLGLSIPKTIDAKLKAEKQSSLFQVAFNGYLNPNTQDSQKVRASASLDTSQRQVRAMAAYNLDKNPQNKIELDAHYDLSEERQYASVKGDLNAYQRKYRYSAEAKLGALYSGQNSENEIKIRVTKPDGRDIDLETSCHISTEGSMRHVAYHGRFKCPEGKVYQAEGRFACSSKCSGSESRCEGAQGSLKGQATFKAPSAKEVTLSVDTEADIQEQQQHARCLVKLSGEQLRMPMKTEFEYDNSNEHMSAKVDLDFGSSSKMGFNGRAQATKTESAFRDGSFEFNVQLPKNKKYQVKANKKSQSVDFSLSLDGQEILIIEQGQPQEGAWYGRVTTPSRRAEAHSQITTNSLTMTVYPNRKENERKYEASGHFRQSESEVDVGARFQQPEGQKSVFANFAMEQQSANGKLEIDIFRNPSDKITIHVHSARTAERSYRVETDVRIPTQHIQPRIEVELALSPKAKAFEIKIKKSPSAKPSFESQVKLNTITAKSSNFYASLTTPSDKFEIASNLQAHELPQCRGVSANGTFTSRRHGEHDFAAASCAPLYAEFGTKQRSQDKIFMVKVGMKNPSSIKVAVDEVYNSAKAITTQSVKYMQNTVDLYGKQQFVPKKSVALVGAKLWTPYLVSLDLQYNTKEVEEFKQKAQQVFDGARSVAKELKQVPSQFKQEVFPRLPQVSQQLSQQLQQIQAAISQEIQQICRQARISLPSMKSIKERTEKVIREASRMCQQARRQVDRALEASLGVNSQDIHQALRRMDRQIQKQMKQAFAESKRIAHALQDGSREAMREVKSLRWVIETVERSSIWDYLLEKLAELEEKFQEEMNYAKEVVQQLYDAAMDEARQIWESLMDNAIIRKFVKWIESLLFTEIRDEDPSWLESAAQKMFSLSMSDKGALIRAQVPLRRPVASLSAAAFSVGVSLPYSRSISRGWNGHYSFLNVIATQSKHARIDRNSAVTFNGLHLPLSFSPCEILLAEDRGYKIIIKKQNAQSTHVKIFNRAGDSVTLYLPANRVPSFTDLRPHSKKPWIDVKQDKESQSFMIDVKTFTIYAKRNSVLEVKSKRSETCCLQGLLGAHQRGQGRDAHQKPSPQEPHRLTKEAARKLMEIYRVDKSCKIPRN